MTLLYRGNAVIRIPSPFVLFVPSPCVFPAIVTIQKGRGIVASLIALVLVVLTLGLRVNYAGVINKTLIIQDS